MLRYQEIKQQLADMIAHMEPNTALPPRSILCESLDTTRSTLHKAITELAAEGKVKTLRGSGTYVAGNVASNGQTIGILIPNNTQVAYRNLISSIEHYLSEKNINVLLSCTEGNVQIQQQKLTRLLAQGIAGLIIVPAFCNDLTYDYMLQNRLKQYNIPVVFCYRGIEGFLNTTVVCYNNFHMGYLATKHLIQQGYRHIMYMSEYMLRTTLDRYQGYVTAMIEHDYRIVKDTIVLETFRDGAAHEYEDMCRILQSGTEPRIDAVFCQPDYLIPEVCRAIKDSGLRVSDDVGVITVDNSDICFYENPKITSIGGQDFEIGQKASEIIWKMMQGIPYYPPLHLVLPKIYQRESCLGPRPAAD